MILHSVVLFSDNPEGLFTRMANFLRSFSAANIHTKDAGIVSITQSESMTSHQSRSAMPGGIPSSDLAWHGTITIIYKGEIA